LTVFEKKKMRQAWWLMPIIPASWEAKIGRIMVERQTPEGS
jgi:hypothetical protein